MFRKLTYLGQYSNRSQIRENIIWRIREAFTNIGAYYNMVSGAKTYDGSDIWALKPGYRTEFAESTGFRFWQGTSTDWVWENAELKYTGGSLPLKVSGVYVDGSFYPTGTVGNKAFYVDYAKGAIVFDNPQNSGSQIYCERSERAVFIYPTKSTQYKTIFTEHMRRFENYAPGSGNDTAMAEMRSFLPAIFVDVQQNDSNSLQLGDITKIQNFSVSFDILCEDAALHDTLVDSILGLYGQSIQMFDVNQVVENKKLPLNYRGEIDISGVSASGLYALYPWKSGRFSEDPVELEGYTALPLYKSTVNFDFEIAV